MNHIIRCTLLLFLCSFFTSGYGAAFALPTAPPQHGIVDNLVGGINQLRGKKNFHLTPQDAFSRLMGDALVKARGKISLEQVSTAEIYFNEVFSHGSPAMQKGLTEMTFVLGKELDKVYFSSGTKYRALSNLLREVFSHLRAIAIQDEELAAQKRNAQQILHFEQRTQVERLFLLYRSLQSVATAVSDGVRQWLGRLPWIKMLLGAGAIYGGVKLYKNKTIPKIWEMAKSAKAFFDTGTTMMREQERQQRAFFEEHAEIDWVATVNNATERDATELSQKYEVHVVKYKKPQNDQEIGQFVYLTKQNPLPDDYPAEFEKDIRTAYKESKSERTEQQREVSRAQVHRLLEQWKTRIREYRTTATEDKWIHLPPSTIDRLAAAGRTLAPILKENAHLLRQSRLQQEAWYADNNIAKEIFNREERPAMRSTLKVLSQAEERHFYRKAEQIWRTQNLGAAPDREAILHIMGPLVLKNENNYEMRYVQFNNIDEVTVTSIQDSLEGAGHFGWYYDEAGNKVTPTIYKGRGDLFTSQEIAVANIESTGLHRTLLPTRNIVEQVLNRVFDPLTDRESALGGILHESHSLLERNRLDGENWFKGINPVYTDEQRTQPMTGWPHPGDPEYATHKDRQYFVGAAVSDYQHPPAVDGAEQHYRHYPSENVLKGLTDAIGSINHAGSPVGSFLGNLGGTLEKLNESTLASLSRYLEKDGAGNLIRPIRLKPMVERRKVHAPGTAHHDRYYLVFVNAAGHELLSEGGQQAPDNSSHHAGRYIEDSGVNGLWDALSSLSHNRGTDMSKLVRTADTLVDDNGISAVVKDLIGAENLRELLSDLDFSPSGLRMRQRPIAHERFVPADNATYGDYKVQLTALYKEAEGIHSEAKKARPKGWRWTRSSAARGRIDAAVARRDGAAAQMAMINTIIKRVNAKISELGADAVIDPVAHRHLLASPSPERPGGSLSVASSHSGVRSVSSHDDGDGRQAGAGTGWSASS